MYYIKKISIICLVMLFIIGCTPKSINDLTNNETNTNDIKENENINNNSQQSLNASEENIDTVDKSAQINPNKKNESISKDEGNENNKNEKDDYNKEENTDKNQNETAEKYVYVKDAIIYSSCPNGYSDGLDGENCYESVEAIETWGCSGKVIDGVCFDTAVDKEYYCDGNDMYWEVKDRGIVKERLCLRYVLDVINPNALGACPDDYTLNEENNCEAYIHTMENKYQAHIRYNCKSGYIPYENTCIKESEFRYIHSCPEDGNYNAIAYDYDKSNNFCYNTSLKVEHILKETCENDNLILIEGKCYSLK